jgi:hypothetical protein
MTDEEQALFDAMCNARNRLAESISGVQRVLDEIDEVAIKMLLYLLYQGKEQIED